MAASKISGGDRMTLRPGFNTVDGCEIRDVSRTERTYTPTVSLQGVGNVVRRSKLHDTRHSAILFGGNDHAIELNDISRACTFSSDCGAV